MTPIIEVKNLSKKYKIGEQQPYLTLRDSLANLVKNPFKKIKEGLSKDEFWALKDINFTVEPGEVIGIIGRNGAGKSTLLKVLSRITPPSTGEVILRGRVGSLLEVGTGFQQELTGRENIYLNGAILGMSQREIKRKFDEIVDFAEVEKFIDTPVKHYSSGMYMRLAFSIAAHLDPEILIVDEVLAVGDISFQEKSLSKMNKISKNDGKTIIIVSHDFGALESLCRTGLLMEKGHILQKDHIHAIQSKYASKPLDNQTEWHIVHEVAPHSSYISKIWVSDMSHKQRSVFYNSENIYINFQVNIVTCKNDYKLGYDLICDNSIVYRSHTTDNNGVKLTNGINTLMCNIPQYLLNAGKYYVKPIFNIHNKHEIQSFDNPVISFDIRIDSSKNIFHTVLKKENNPGFIFPQLNWLKNNV